MTFEETIRKEYSTNLLIAMEELNITYETELARRYAKDWTIDDLTQRMYKIMDKQ
jgi:hypothetical protein